jgi:2-polyprenyl-3-methyl-5-hydroxy-6-metoxy-1,4-benzoquinol methylase
MKQDNVQLEQLDRCPLCQSKQIKLWSAAKDKLHRTGNTLFAYHHCQQCDLVFQSKRPPAHLIAGYYPDDYSPHGNAGRKAGFKNPLRFITKLLVKQMDVAMRKRTLIAQLEAELAAIDAKLPSGGTMVDFGCGAGNYLQRAKKHGCTAIGVDFSPNALAEVRAKGFTALPVSDETWQSLGSDQIGFFRMNHVIEHLYDPTQTLDHIFNALKPGGFLHVATPNPKGAAASQYRADWFGLDCPRHIMLLPPQTCKAFLEARGFTNVRFFYDTHPKDIVRSWAYRLEGRFGVRLSKNVTALASNTFLNFLASRFVRIGTLNENGDRYHITAQKPTQSA